ncbi:MAG: hypothetical protein ACTSQQ_14480, partial [Candidatus Helarchaeota archaeon]
MLLFEKSFESSQIDPDLFSSLLSAIRNFSSAIHMGELTSFTTQNKTILVSLTEETMVALMLKLNESIDEWQGKAFEIGRHFNKKYDLSVFNGNRSQFLSFNESIDTILKQKMDPFVIQV